MKICTYSTSTNAILKLGFAKNYKDSPFLVLRMLHIRTLSLAVHIPLKMRSLNRRSRFHMTLCEVPFSLNCSIRMIPNLEPLTPPCMRLLLSQDFSSKKRLPKKIPKKRRRNREGMISFNRPQILLPFPCNLIVFPIHLEPSLRSMIVSHSLDSGLRVSDRPSGRIQS